MSSFRCPTATDPMPVHYQGVSLRELTAETVDALLAAAGPDVEVPLMLVEIRQLGGAVFRAGQQLG